MNTLAIVLASAGTAAFVAGVMTLFGQLLERRAKRQELLLSKAVQIAILRVELLMKTADRNQQAAAIPDLPYLTEKYYQALEHLMAKGQLPPQLRDQYDNALERLQAEEKPSGVTRKQ